MKEFFPPLALDCLGKEVLFEIMMHLSVHESYCLVSFVRRIGRLRLLLATPIASSGYPTTFECYFMERFITMLSRLSLIVNYSTRLAAIAIGKEDCATSKALEFTRFLGMKHFSMSHFQDD
jgi:hypothetical protein